MKKKLIIVAGPPACGKNFVSDKILRAIGNVSYIDKDDLSELVKAAFTVANEQVNMDMPFYRNNIRPFEYATLEKLCFTALEYQDLVLINAPFIKEAEDISYMRSLKSRANQMGAELIFVWVYATKETCFERMKTRNAKRDKNKLENFDEYIRSINFEPPQELEDYKAVDRLIVFNNSSEIQFESSLQKTIDLLR